MQKEVEGFILKNGAEWTCSRYKAIWNAAMHLKNGDPESARKVYQDNSIAYHRGSMLPKGAWGFAVANFVKAKSPSAVRRWAAVLRYYTTISLSKPSQTQIAKFTDAVETPPVRESFEPEGRKLAELVCSERGFVRKYDFQSLVAQGLNNSKLHGTSYYYSGVSPSEVKEALSPEMRRQFTEALHQPFGKMLLSLMTESWIPSPLRGISEEDGLRQSAYMVHHRDDGTSGRIVMLQQQGCKGRTVFQPTAELQRHFQALATACERIAMSLFPREACWLDQQDGAYQALALLANGKTLFSVDQSSATDRFPRTLSEGVINYFGLNDYSQALEEVCSRPWNCEFLGRPVKVATGQPMGLYGSFALYNLSNLMIAELSRIYTVEQEKTVESFQDGSCFKVVGDDIIFSDGRVADNYRKILSSLGVKVSEAKSFSGQLGEFAGFVLYASGDKAYAFRPYKYPMENYISNPLDFLHSVGSKVSKLSDRWNLHWRAYQDTLSQRYLDLSPLVRGEEGAPTPSKTGMYSSVASTALILYQSLCEASKNARPGTLLASFSSNSLSRTHLFLSGNDPLEREDPLIRYLTRSVGVSPQELESNREVLTREDYIRDDTESRLAGHHITDKRLVADPLISDYEYRNQIEPSESAWRDAARLLKELKASNKRSADQIQIVGTGVNTPAADPQEIEAPDGDRDDI
jgi:hypothetical protein